MPQNIEASPLEPFVNRLCYRVDLDAAERAAVRELPFTVKRTERSHFIVREREKCVHTCVLLSGFAIRSKLVATGHRQIVSTHMKGEAVDLQNSMLEISDHSVQMLTAGKIAQVPREAIIGLALQWPRVAQAMWKDTLVDGSISREWITNVGRRDARARIAHLLCEFALRMKVAGLGQDNLYELPMTQEQLADATGLTPVHVNRTIKSLEGDGLIQRTNPRSIFVGDWRRLAEVGDFDSNYLHLNENEAALQ